MIRETRVLMGMPITVEIVDDPPKGLVDDVFAHFAEVDRRFSPFNPESEVSALNQHLVLPIELSAEMVEVLAIADRTRQETRGYFEIRRPDGRLDPSGIVKGWAIRNAAALIEASGVRNFFVDAGGDIQSRGKSADGDHWRAGIRNPFNEREIIKAIVPRGRGIATSGTYAREQHIYDPYWPGRSIVEIVSLTVIGPDVLEADRFATAAFAMGRSGIYFIEDRPELEGYVVDLNGIATQTSGFKAYVAT
jgi:FAD:protein FMN transferase